MTTWMAPWWPWTPTTSRTSRRPTSMPGARLELFDGRWSQSLRYGIAATDTDTTAEEFFDDGNPDDGGFDRSSTNGDKYGVYYQSAVRGLPGTAESPGNLLTVAIDHEREEFSQRGEPSLLRRPQPGPVAADHGLCARVHLLHRPRPVGLGQRAPRRQQRFRRREHVADDGVLEPARHGTRLHGSYGTGQKSPTFFERFGYTPDTFVGNPDLEPEKSTGWDAGVEQRWLDGRLVADVTYFRADLDNEINGFYCPPPEFACTAINEDGKSHREGVETTVGARAHADLLSSAPPTRTRTRARATSSPTAATRASSRCAARGTPDR